MQTRTNIGPMVIKIYTQLRI